MSHSIFLPEICLKHLLCPRWRRSRVSSHRSSLWQHYMKLPGTVAVCLASTFLFCDFQCFFTYVTSIKWSCNSSINYIEFLIQYNSFLVRNYSIVKIHFCQEQIKLAVHIFYILTSLLSKHVPNSYTWKVKNVSLLKKVRGSKNSN